MLLFIGIQATGKSEFFKRNFYRTHIRLNMDMLKTRHRESILFEACLRAKQPFVIDNTNPTAKERQRYIPPAKAAGFDVIGYYFASGIRDAITRNDLRTGKERLPVKAILGTHAKLERPGFIEGFDVLYYVSINPNGEFEVGDYRDEI